MNYIEFMSLIVSVICIVDIIRTLIYMHQYKDLLALTGLNDTTRFFFIIELWAIIFIAGYWIFKLVKGGA